LKNKKTILVYLSLFFILLFGIIMYLNEKNYEERIDLVLSNKLSKLETNYKIFMYNQKVLADNIFDDTMNIKSVLEILTQANETQDTNKITFLRDKLQKILEKKYSQIKAKGILQYHFVFPNNHVFLRMHKPSKFADDLTGIRQDFEYVNKYKKIVRGFSNGRTAHGFRNVYPIFNEQKQYLGAVEVSFSSELLQEYLQNISGIHSHFLINKSIFDSKAWERDDMVMKYFQSAENSDLMFHITSSHTHERCIVNNTKNLLHIKDKIAAKIKLKEKFVLHIPTSIQSNVIAFYPVKQNITQDVVAWVVSYEYVHLIDTIYKDKNYILVSTFIFLLIVFYFFYKNITQQQLIKQKSQEQERLLSLFDKGDSVLFKWKNDENWSVEHVSKSVETLLGYTVEEILQNKIPYSSSIHLDDLQTVIDEVKEGSKSKNDFFAHNPYRVITKDNKIKWVLDYTTIVRDVNGNIEYFIGYIVDISEQKNKERLLFEQSKLASMGEMIGNIAHQWRQPLSVISTSATGLQMQYQYGVLDKSTIPSICETINDNAQYLSTTIDDFRNFIKGERELKKFNIKDTITSFLHLVKPSIKSHNIDVVLLMKDNIEIEGYENELQQCFINIFNNSKDALKELEDQKKLLFIEVLEEDEKHIKITFKDNGNGIDEAIIEKVFEPYFTTKHQSQGTGLGLHMTYNMITGGMHGKISIENVKYEYKKSIYYGAQINIILPKVYGDLD